MSRWNLLRQAVGGCQLSDTTTADGLRNHCNESIHRFQGYEVVHRKKIIWKGFRLHLSSHELEQVTSYQQLFDKIDLFMREHADCTECLVVLCHGSKVEESVCRMIKKGVDSGVFRLPPHKTIARRSEDHGVENSATTAVSVRGGGGGETATAAEPTTTSTGNDAQQPALTGRGGDLSSIDQFYVTTCSFSPILKACSYGVYKLPMLAREGDDAFGVADSLAATTAAKMTSATVKVYTRENAVNGTKNKVTKAGLLSHKLHGVDNTGNIRVWSSESVLLHSILNTPTLQNRFRRKRVLELGGGLTGLCGLGLAASGLCSDVVITDGHPDCVTNQRVCIQMGCQMGSFEGFRSGVSLGWEVEETGRSSVRSELLRWSKGDQHGDLRRILEGEDFGGSGSGSGDGCSVHDGESSSSGSSSGGDSSGHSTRRRRHFDIVVAADCLFFKEFHKDLIWTIRHALTDLGEEEDRRGTQNNPNETFTVPSATLSINTTVGPTTSNSISLIASSRLNATGSELGESAAVFSDTSESKHKNESPHDDNGRHHQGVCYLLQPRRGGTLDLFVQRATPFFDVIVSEDYSDEITAMRRAYLSDEQLVANGTYDEDIHYPVLVTMRLK